MRKYWKVFSLVDEVEHDIEGMLTMKHLLSKTVALGSVKWCFRYINTDVMRTRHLTSSFLHVQHVPWLVT